MLSLMGGIKTGRIGHAYLFAGPRGVGKTTTARILAKSLNCTEGPTIQPCQKCQSCKEITLSRSIDVVEIDGASNRGIEEIRNLREGVKYSPIHGRYKVYIIDEVHMLTQEAFNALLKTLEEPPVNVVFIFATTNPTKVPPTILSRCQRFVFKRLSVKEISQRLTDIAKKESIEVTPDAVHYIAVRADGSIRDGESILEQLAAFVEGSIEKDDVFRLIGFLGNQFYHELLGHVLLGKLEKVFLALNKGIEEGGDPIEVYRGFTQYLRGALLVLSNLPADYLDLNNDEIDQVRSFKVSRSKILSLLKICLENENMVRRSVNARIALELLFGQLALSEKNPQVPIANGRGVDKIKLSDPGAEKPDYKSILVDSLQQKSPQVAGVICKAKVAKRGSKFDIYVDSEFSQRQLNGSLKNITEILTRATKKDVSVTIHIEQSEHTENDLIKNIKGLFDGEEVR